LIVFVDNDDGLVRAEDLVAAWAQCSAQTVTQDSDPGQ
jgi:hypothetical protein